MFQQDGSAPYGDATKEWMLRHIEQLSPIFSEFEDVIDVVQAGFIGVWGTLSPQTICFINNVCIYKLYTILLLYLFVIIPNTSCSCNIILIYVYYY